MTLPCNVSFKTCLKTPDEAALATQKYTIELQLVLTILTKSLKTRRYASSAIILLLKQGSASWFWVDREVGQAGRRRGAGSGSKDPPLRRTVKTSVNISEKTGFMLDS